MKVSIRLYRTHDMDLVTLHKNPNINLRQVIKTALDSYVSSIPYHIPIPEPDPESRNYKSVYQLFLDFDDIKDAEIVKWLKNIKPGYRTAAIKCVIRGCLVGPIVYACMQDEQKGRELEIKLKNKDDNGIVLHQIPEYVTKKKKKVEKAGKKNKLISKKKNPVDKIKKPEAQENVETKQKNPEKEEMLDFNDVPIQSFAAQPIETQPEIDMFSGFGDSTGSNDNEDDEFDMFKDLNNMLNSF